MKEKSEELYKIADEMGAFVCKYREVEHSCWDCWRRSYNCVRPFLLYKLAEENYRKIIKCKDCADRNTEGCRLSYWDGDKLVSDTEDDGFCCFARAKMKGGAE